MSAIGTKRIKGSFGNRGFRDDTLSNKKGRDFTRPAARPAWGDRNVDFLAHGNWLHSSATRDEMLIAPADVNLGEVALKDSFSNSR